MPDVKGFLREDLGRRGDWTTHALFGTRPIPATARVWTRQAIVAAGLPEAADAFRLMGGKVTLLVKEGARVKAGAALLEIRGSLQGILSAERVALNLVGRMSGIATTTRELVERVHRINPGCAVAGTRKTTPGIRALEKRAIILGGGDPHRFGLFDAILIKDNHLAALPDVREAVRRAKRGAGGTPIEIEVSNPKDAEVAAEAGAEWILIDNLPPAFAKRVATVARRANPKVKIEVSGGLTPQRLPQYARFADRLSMGSLTHSAASADVTLDLVVPKH